MTNLRQSARGRECQVRIPGICNHNPETVVLAHIGGAGIGRKSDDIHGAFCCSACHDAIDGRSNTEYHRSALKLLHLEGVVRTQEIWRREGLL